MIRYISCLLAVTILSSCSNNNPKPIEYKKGDFWIANFRNNSFPSKALIDDKIYCTGMEIGNGRSNFLYCLNLKTGRVDWATKVENWASQPPIVTDSFIYFSSFTGNICKLDKDGIVIWKKQLEGSFSGFSCNPINSNLFVGTVQNGVYEFSSANGKQLNQYGKATLSVSVPIFFKDKMYIAGLKDIDTVKARGDFIYCFDQKSSNAIWKKYTDEDIDRLFLDSGKIYFIDRQRRLNCIDPETGATFWQSSPLQTSGFYTLSPTLIFEDKFVYCYNSDLNNITKIDKSSGKILKRDRYWQFMNEKSLLPKTQVYAISEGNNKYTIKVSDSLETPEYDIPHYNITVNIAN